MTTREAMSKTRVAIGVMTRNHAGYLAEAVESVLSQEYGDWEMTISDDASTDGTSEIAAEFARRDARIRYVRHDQNLGQAGNWRFLLEGGDAPLLAVLHGDDYWMPGAIGRAVQAFDADDQADIVYGNWWRKLPGRSEPILIEQNRAHVRSGLDEFRSQARRFQCHVSATFLTRRVVRLAGWPNRELKIMVDYEYLLRAMLRARHVVSLAEPLAVYRSHEENTTTEGYINGSLLAEQKLLPGIVAHALAHGGVTGADSALVDLRRKMAGDIFSYGVSVAAQGNLSEGRILMDDGVRQYPPMRTEPKIFIDRCLCRAGAGGYRLFRRLHGRRLNA